MNINPALRKLAGVIPDKMFANSQKEAKAQTGSVGNWASPYFLQQNFHLLHLQ